MISEILILDPSGSPVPQCIGELFDESQTLITRFSGMTSLCIYLSTYTNYTLTQQHDRIERVPNSKEKELDHCVGLIINTDKKGTSGILDTLSFEEQQTLVASRFHHLNLVAICQSLTDSSTKSVLSSRFLPVLRHIYKHIQTRLLRVQTWVGLTDADKYPEINTMGGITKTQVSAETGMKNIRLFSTDIRYIELLDLPHDDEHYKSLIAKWGFPAFELTYDELLYCAYLMFDHALIGYRDDYQTPGFRNRLMLFLFYIRDYYRKGNPFHNFRHAIDVMQSINYFLGQLEKSDFELRLEKHESLALLLAALGHDIGHPGTTNAFLITHKTPIAAIFDNQSILEQYHLAQYLKIMKLFFARDDRCVEIARCSILATDMAKHDAYVHDLDRFDEYVTRQEKLQLICAILIKSADISNVCRPVAQSVKWGLSLGREFAEIGQLEKALKGEETATLKPLPVPLSKITPEEAIEFDPDLDKSQMFFINRFALEFFTKVADRYPPLACLSQELHKNIAHWQLTGKTGN
ncbi:hypothetical protein OGAPHI_007441 [Ogataea philodendri]|uniref:Phosphodiesterase n=1 Tax=Ogataea philodendri TaxID=1378263 RepID=A0A9P8NW08_9ASCO|nr:uncharacterized protein OGAPHI_007441 [Ogataea philodendri]KAH3660236.1 hypothetical protein OGAPHI_007441 [Ogataea philodendri]